MSELAVTIKKGQSDLARDKALWANPGYYLVVGELPANIEPESVEPVLKAMLQAYWMGQESERHITKHGG